MEEEKKTAPSSPAASIKSTYKLIGVADLFKSSLELYSSRLKTFLGVVVISLLLNIVGLVLLLLPFIVLVFMGYNIANNFKSASMPQISSPLIILFVLVVVVLFLVMFFLSTWGQLALLTAITKSEERIGIIDSFRQGFKKVLPFLWLSILSGLVIMGGIFLLVIPGIIFAIWFSFAVYILVSENIGGMNALLKSREYVKGRFWGIVGRMLLLTLVTSIIIYLPLFVSGDFFKSGTQQNPLLSLIIMILSILIAPFSASYTYILFQNLRALKANDPFMPNNKMKLVYLLFALLVPVILIGIFLTVGTLIVNTFQKPLSSPVYNQKKSQGSLNNNPLYVANYEVVLNPDGTVTVSAPNAELGEIISLTR